MRIKAIKFIISLCIPLLFCSLYGQSQIYVQGVVYENVKGAPLVGASVMLMNKNDRIMGGTATDLDGKFKFLVPEGIEKIAFSFIGFVTQTYTLEADKNYEIVLKEVTQSLDEAVVVARRIKKANTGMIQRDRVYMSNAISSVEMEALEHQSVTSVDQLLQGAAPGLQVSFNSGDPGAGASLRIRGISSLEANSSPLWVIDGVEVVSDEYKVSDLQNFGSNPIGNLDPSDIESIDVLKDASSTAIYGSRGANGVIVIKTKQGRKGKPQFNFSMKFTNTFETQTIPLLNGDQQRMFVIEAEANANGGVDNVNNSNLALLRGDLTSETAWLYNNNTNMYKMITRNGFLQNYNFSLSGGGDRLAYYWSMTYNTSYGTKIGGGENRFTSTIKLDYTMSTKLKISTKFSYSNSLIDKRSWAWPIKGFNRWANVQLNPQALARQRAAFLPVYNKNGTEYYIEDEGNGGHAIPSIGTRMYNPIAMIDNATFTARKNQFTALLGIDYTILSSLMFSTKVTVDYNQEGNEFFAPSEALGVKEHHPSYNNGKRDDSYSMQLTNKNMLTYNPLNTENHFLQLTGIVDLIYKKEEVTSLAYNRSASSDLMESNAASMIGGAGGHDKLSTTLSAIVDMQYRYKNRYNFNFNIKTEGSSKYGKDNPFSLFPTAGFSWTMQNEPFMKDKEWLDEFKPYFGFGMSGQMPSVDAMLSVTYANNPNGYMGDPYTYISKFANDNLHEERTTEFNYGISCGFFNRRITFNADIYKKKTRDLLMDEIISNATGFTKRKTNFGTMENKGWELALNVVPIDLTEADFKWSVYFSISHNENKMLKIPARLADSEGYKESYGYGGFRAKLEEGSALGAIYGYKAKGVYARDEDAYVHDFNGNVVYTADGTPKKLRYGSATGAEFKGGDMIYEDVNHDGVINDLDVVQIGNANVGYYGLFRHNLNWKQWAMGISFYYNFDQDVINGQRYQLENMNSESNQATSVMRRWRKQGDITDMPRAERYCERNYAASSRFIEDVSYLKLKEISLTYSFNKNLVKKLRLSTLALSCTCENIFTWTKYKGLDPEIAQNKGSLIKIGIDEQTTPTNSFKLTFGLRATF